MPLINLDQKGISINGPEFNAIAPNLQSNILKSHSRPFVRLLFIKFTNEDASPRVWIKGFISQEKYVVSAMDQKEDTAAFKNGLAGKTVANFYLTASGYKNLGLSVNKFMDNNSFVVEEETEEDDEEEAGQPGNIDFKKGMKSKRVNKKLHDPKPEEWEPEYTNDIDIAGR
jgi:hypothetical protein